MSDKTKSKSRIFEKQKATMQKTWKNHSHFRFVVFCVMLILSIASIIGGGICVSIATSIKIPQININQTAINQTVATPPSESEAVSFKVPDAILGSVGLSTTVQVNCTITNSTFIQDNTPSLLALTVTGGSTYSERFSEIRVEPTDAIWGIYSGFPQTFYPSSLYPFDLFPTNLSISDWATDEANNTIFNSWTGNQTYIFEDSGSISLNIIIYMTPLVNFTSNEPPFQPYYNTTLPFPSISFTSETTILQERELSMQTQYSAELVQLVNQTQTRNDAQQSSNQFMDWGLTLVIVFIALLDVSFVIYDHSETEESKAKSNSSETQKEILGVLQQILNNLQTSSQISDGTKTNEKSTSDHKNNS